MGSFDISQAALVAIGAFYTFAGIVGLRVAVQGRFMDMAIAGISATKPPAAETARGLWLLCSSVVVLAGGLFLVLRLQWSAAVFAVSALSQALYLLVLAPRIFDPADPPDARGRQQTINAFILYSAATLFVLWAHRSNRLTGPDAVGWPAVWFVLGLIAAALAWGLFRFFYPFATGPASVFERTAGGLADRTESERYGDADEDAEPLSASRRILVMSEYQCDPLWSHDPGRSGSFSPRELPLSDALIADLEAWALSYDGSFNMEDLNNPHWSEAQYRAHDEAGIALARQLKRELPDRQIFVWRLDNGHTEISAD
jgi:hypothetical protein